MTNGTAGYQPILQPNEMIAVTEALEQGDVTALVVTAEVVAREWAFVRGVILGAFAVRQDGGEWVFVDREDGSEVGRIFDVKSRP